MWGPPVAPQGQCDKYIHFIHNDMTHLSFSRKMMMKMMLKMMKQMMTMTMTMITITMMTMMTTMPKTMMMTTLSLLSLRNLGVSYHHQKLCDMPIFSIKLT
jgi:hypothetical protein